MSAAIHGFASLEELDGTIEALDEEIDRLNTRLRAGLQLHSRLVVQAMLVRETKRAEFQRARMTADDRRRASDELTRELNRLGEAR